MEHDTQQLTERIAAGDPEAFAAFYREWFEFMEHLAGRVASRATTPNDESFRLDVVHDAMLRVIRAMPVLRTRRDMERWLTAVVKSCAYELLRRQRRRARREQMRARDAPRATGALDPTQRDDELAWLRRELASLDAPRMTMLRMRHQLGWTLARIGRTLGLSPGAVDGKMKRLIEELRARAGEERCS